MRKFGGAAGGVSTRFRGVEDRVRKLGAVGAWLCFVLLLGLAAVPTASAQTVTYIHTDALGSVVAKSDANGNVMESYDYEPYGAVVGGPVADGPGYTGHVSDSTTGLSYMQQRYMDPQLGVFLSTDPITADAKTGAKFNRYAYALNNPYKFIDPDGRDETWFSNVDQMGNPGFGNELGDDAFNYNGKALLAVGISGATLPGILRAIAAPFGRAAIKEMQGPTVAGVKVGDGPADTRAALDGAGYKGTPITNDAGTETGTLHNVPSMKMDVRVMDGGPKHPPRVSVTREGNPRQPVNPENGKNFGNIPKAEQRTGSHIYYRERR